ncbi:MAG: ArsR/SmtB family transcription factor [Candidatus Hodarchaeales archaeon]|jgi:ArsR family transcriptional regulator
METEHADFCCPIDPGRKSKWLERLQNQRDNVIAKHGEIIAEQELMLKTLSHPIRLKILHHLHQKPNCVCELVKKLGASNSAVSYHLSYLAKFLLINDKLSGGNVYYYRTKFGKQMMQWIEQIPKEL